MQGMQFGTGPTPQFDADVGRFSGRRPLHELAHPAADVTTVLERRALIATLSSFLFVGGLKQLHEDIIETLDVDA